MPKLIRDIPMPCAPRDLAAHYARVRRILRGAQPVQVMRARDPDPEPEPERIEIAPYVPPTPRQRLRAALDTLRDDPSVTDVMRAVAQAWGLTIFDLAGRNQSPDVTVPRNIAMALAVRLTESSKPRIGRLFGGRDHSTVFHSVQRYQPLIDEVMGEKQ